MVARPKYRKIADGYEITVGGVSIFVRDTQIFVIGAKANDNINRGMECSTSMSVADPWSTSEAV